MANEKSLTKEQAKEKKANELRSKKAALANTCCNRYFCLGH